MHINVGKTYKAINRDGVEIKGIVKNVNGDRIEFGDRRAVYIIIHGWTFYQLD